MRNPVIVVMCHVPPRIAAFTGMSFLHHFEDQKKGLLDSGLLGEKDEERGEQDEDEPTLTNNLKQ
jgi:hypothetical protein